MIHNGFFFSLITALLLLPLPGVAEKKEHSTLEFGHIELRPFGYTNEDGEASGYLVDVSRAVLKRIGQPVYFQELPASRLYQQIANGTTAMALGPAGLHQLANHAYESKEPAVALTLAVYRKPSTPAVSSLEELRGKRLVLMHGYSYGRLGRFFERAEDSMQLARARTHESALKMILRDRAEYLFSYRTPVNTAIAENNFENLTYDPITTIPVHFFVSSKVPGAAEMVRQWDRYLLEMRESGELQKLQPNLESN